MHCPIIPRDIGGFAGKKQCIFHRTSQSFLRAVGTDRSIAIGAARKWVALPVMKISIVKKVLQLKSISQGEEELKER